MPPSIAVISVEVNAHRAISVRAAIFPPQPATLREIHLIVQVAVGVHTRHKVKSSIIEQVVDLRI